MKDKSCKSDEGVANAIVLTGTQAKDIFIKRVLQLSSCVYNSNMQACNMLPIVSSDELHQQDIIGDFFSHVAILLELFGDKEEAVRKKVPLEAWFWSNEGKAVLRALGWLEGNLVIIDEDYKEVIIPHTQEPAFAIRLPIIRGDGKADLGIGIINMFKNLDYLHSCWQTSVINDTRIMPWLTSRKLLQNIGDHFSNSCVCDLKTDSFSHLFNIFSKRVHMRIENDFKKYSGIYENVNESLSNDPSKIAKILREHLLYIIIVNNLAIPRSPHSQVSDMEQRINQQPDEFLKFLKGLAPVTKREEELGILFVQDGEISFVLLLHLLSQIPISKQGQEINQEYIKNCLYEQLYLLDKQNDKVTKRGERFTMWVRDLLKLDTKRHDEHTNLESLLKSELWKKIAASLKKHSTNINELTSNILNNKKNSTFSSLYQLCSLIHTPSTECMIEELSPISISIFMMLRKYEVAERSLIAFPVSQISASLLPSAVSAYFVGTIKPVKDIETTDQIGVLQNGISLVMWHDAHRISVSKIDQHRKTVNTHREILHIFGHFIGGLLKDSGIVGLNSLVNYKDNIPSKDIINVINMLWPIWGISQMGRIIKLGKGRFRMDWLNPSLRGMLVNSYLVDRDQCDWEGILNRIRRFVQTFLCALFCSREICNEIQLTWDNQPLVVDVDTHRMMPLYPFIEDNHLSGTNIVTLGLLELIRNATTYLQDRIGSSPGRSLPLDFKSDFDSSESSIRIRIIYTHNFAREIRNKQKGEIVSNTIKDIQAMEEEFLTSDRGPICRTKQFHVSAESDQAIGEWIFIWKNISWQKIG